MAVAPSLHRHAMRPRRSGRKRGVEIHCVTRNPPSFNGRKSSVMLESVPLVESMNFGRRGSDTSKKEDAVLSPQQSQEPGTGQNVLVGGQGPSFSVVVVVLSGELRSGENGNQHGQRPDPVLRPRDHALSRCREPDPERDRI